MSMFCETAPAGLPAALAMRFAARVPVLETSRLILRAPEAVDFPTYADIACGPRAEGIGGPMTREEAWYDFASLAAGWMLRGHGGWTITRRDTGARIGFALIGAEPGDEAPELGYMLTEAHQGQGHATEAARAVRDYGYGTLRLPELVSYIFAANTRSIAVAERLGARLVGEARYPEDDLPALIYRHPRPEEL